MLKISKPIVGWAAATCCACSSNCTESDILLLDEPLSALDAQVRLNLRQKIRSIQTQLNLPTIMVTHDQEEALSISDRVVVMNHGVIEQIDTPHNIYYKPQTQFVAKFIGTMNF